MVGLGLGLPWGEVERGGVEWWYGVAVVWCGMRWCGVVWCDLVGWDGMGLGEVSVVWCGVGLGKVSGGEEAGGANKAV